MTIWCYEETARNSPTSESLGTCIYCGTRFVNFQPTGDGYEQWKKSVPFSNHPACRGIDLFICSICGWWAVSQVERGGHYDINIKVRRVSGALKKLDLTDISIPLEEAKQYLRARYSERYKIHPRKYEEVIASVFRETGYKVRLTSYSGDDGIDVIVLDGDQGDVVGVQAKRYQGKIEAVQIREFAGSLVLNGMTEGIFVTTSSFSKGAKRAVEGYKDHHISIDLWDADRFYSALSIRRRPYYHDPLDPETPFHHFVQDKSKIPLIRDEWLVIW
jgi:restriction system protein